MKVQPGASGTFGIELQLDTELDLQASSAFCFATEALSRRIEQFSFPASSFTLSTPQSAVAAFSAVRNPLTASSVAPSAVRAAAAFAAGSGFNASVTSFLMASLFLSTASANAWASAYGFGASTMRTSNLNQ